MSVIHKRGFGSMSPEQRRAIASQGGYAAQATGKVHRWTSGEASIAGKKGGLQRIANLNAKEQRS